MIAAPRRPNVTQLKQSQPGNFSSNNKGRIKHIQSNERIALGLCVHTVGDGLAHGFDASECGAVADVFYLCQS